MDPIIVQNVVIAATGIFAVLTIFLNYRQMRFNELTKYYELTEGVRKQTQDALRIKDKKEQQSVARSILNNNLNLYETLSYLIFHGGVNEKDAFMMLKQNFFDFHKACKKINLNIESYSWFSKLLERWDTGLVSYYKKQIFIYLACFIGTLVILAVVFFASIK